MTAAELLRWHWALTGKEGPIVEGLIARLLIKVKLQGYERLKIGKYSRGMLQRLGIAQALLGDPQLLVLDEPTSDLDPAGRKEVLDLLATLKAEGKTVFLSSHILPEVEQICDRVVIIDRGHMVRSGQMKKLLNSGNRVEIVADRLDEAGETRVLLVYPMVRYAIYSSIAMALVTIMHPVIAFSIVLLLAVSASVLRPTTTVGTLLPEPVRRAIYAVLPSTELLSETRFLTITQSALSGIPWTHHLTALAYGLDYALVFFLLAIWAFRRRSLIRT